MSATAVKLKDQLSVAYSNLDYLQSEQKFILIKL